MHRREFWFSDNHTHDYHSFVNGTNELVNMENRIANDLGSKYIEIIPENYEGEEEMRIQIIE